MRASHLLRSVAYDWSFPLPTLVGAQKRQSIPAVLAASGAKRPLVVTDTGLPAQQFFQSFLEDLQKSSLEKVSLFSSVHPNPRDTDVAEGVEFYKTTGCDSVICVGGGSGLDAGKCIAMVAESGLPLEALDYWSESPPIPAGGRLPPCITVPTTAGTGAEMNSGSMYTSTREGIKRCAGHSDLPLVAVLDPELSLSLPKSLTAWTGADALVHAIEAYFVPMYHPMCDAIALQSLQKIAKYLPAAVADGSDLEARTEMLVAAALAAVAFQKGLGAVHGLSEPIGAIYESHHGLTNAILLPYVLQELGKDTDDHSAEINRMLGLPSSGAHASTVLIDWVKGFNQELQIPEKLTPLVGDMNDAAVEELAAKAESNPTGFTNFRRFTVDDYRKVIRTAL